jgi:hypothetical protein
MDFSSTPILPYGKQTISEDDITAVVEVLRSEYLTQGPTVPAFEQAVTARVGAIHGVAPHQLPLSHQLIALGTAAPKLISLTLILQRA